MLERLKIIVNSCISGVASPIWSSPSPHLLPPCTTHVLLEERGGVDGRQQVEQQAAAERLKLRLRRV